MRFVSAAQRARYLRPIADGGGVAARVTGDKRPGRKRVQTTRPPLRKLTYTNTRTGATHEGIQGIDRGFEYHVGRERERQLRTQWRERDTAFAGAMEPHPRSTPVRQGLDPSGAQSQRGAALAAIRAVERVHGSGRLTADPDAKKVVPLPIRESATTDKQGEYVPDPRTGKPVRIDLSHEGKEADRWPALIAAEEIGHYLDHAGMSGYAREVGEWESSAQRSPEMKAVIDAILKSPTYGLLPKGEPDFREWPWELWGRAYAQYIAWRSGSSRLKGDLDKALTHDNPNYQTMYWPYDEFAPIAMAIDRLMEARGWARPKLPATT